ncbi:MAG: V-type ATP synthase subunit A [Candidatus Parvarchaeota archaeon]|nr:V-type ATP synthase subunit A [Candidatus Parvarchaeum tengchongense]
MEGKVIGISGSVVTVSGLEDPKMNNIVFIGENELVGEIVKIEEKNAIVQVYEDTSGLKIGEKAIDSKEPLSVELGPGLIGSIFDGIQRPLDKILNKEGTFISSGVKVNSLDREKKWHFKPKVEEGKEVEAGEEIGEVKETSLIKHKVLVPVNQKGIVKKIAEEGDYTVDEIIAVLENDKKTEEIKLMTKWPVRTARPVKEKLSPTIPLLTGQRVIDTMFPVAMGGTAAVPGPFGSGKCVLGETPVLLANGEIKSIEEIYKENENDSDIEYQDENETLLRLKSPLKLFSLYDGKVKESKSKFLYKGKSDSVIRIKTRTGKEAKVTPVHKLFRLDGMRIKEESAENLKKGDYIIAIRRFDVNQGMQRIDPYEYLFDARTIDKNILLKMRDLLKNVKSTNNFIKKDLKYSITRKSKNPAIKLELINRVYKSEGLQLPDIDKVRGDRAGKLMKIPRYADEKFAEFIGLFVAEGYIRGRNTVVFTNSDNKLIKRFNFLVKDLFGLNSTLEIQKDKTPNVLVNSAILVKFIRRLINAKNASEKYIPNIIMKADNKVLSAFIRGYFLGDGSFYGGNVEFSTASKKLQIQLSYTLTRLGIINSMHSEKVKGYNDKNRIYIRNLKELKKFYQNINDSSQKYEKINRIINYIKSKDSSYTSIDLMPLNSNYVENLYKRYSNYSELKEKGIEITNYTSGNENFTVDSFNKFLSAISNSNREGTLELKNLVEIQKMLDFVYFDKITEIEEIRGPFDVYDVVTPEFGSNFVGGNGAILLHNTVIQHQLAKWSDADVIVYVGCGERGNEMTEILTTFPELKDPKSGKPLMDRTILIANTSNMPVAAREASIYTGITLAEYYRDMGYSVAVMADSTSRWAEALRELSGRLEEMPGEEGYPAYLGRRIGEFYERAGRARILSGKIGAATIIGAVSPPGGDISEPVSQNTLRVTRVFWALDASLANARHFPSINWLNSYSLYTDELDQWYRKNIAEDWPELRDKAMATLQKEAEINEIVQLVGYDALPESDKLILDIARMLREDYLQQNAFDETDTYASVSKQYKMLKVINEVFDAEKAALERNVPIEKLQSIQIKPKIARLRYTKEEEIDDRLKEIEKDIETIKKTNTEK